ncbi:MAG TPA: hypothetical protein VGW80_06815 [Solirubrobacterales bacterium]|nr:hypothetical protein [Solirubrobacterales bacterium]
MFAQAKERGDRDLQEPLLQQLVLRSVPIISRAVRDSDVSLGPRDLKAIEDEALIKVLARLARSGERADIRALAYEIGRECALDPDRRLAPAPKLSPPRPKLRIVHG